MVFEYQTFLRDSKTDPLQYLPTIDVILSKRQSLNKQIAYFLAYFLLQVFRRNYTEQQKETIKAFLKHLPAINLHTAGTFMNFSMNEKYLQFVIDVKKSVLLEKLNVNILEMLKEWMKEFEQLKKQIKNPKLDIFERILKFIVNQQQYSSQIEDKIVFLNYCFKDILVILPTEVNQHQQVDIDTNKLGKPENIIIFMQKVFPKIMHNILVTSEFFPADVIKAEVPSAQYDLLYIVQNLQTLIRGCENYLMLLKILLNAMIKIVGSLDPELQPKVLDLAFRYYYVFHKLPQAEEFVLTCIKGISNAVRFAIGKQIMLFITIVQKLGHRLFLEQLESSLQGLKELKDKLNRQANPKNGLNPLMGSEIELTVSRGAKQIRCIEVLRQFSLIYFDINCKSADVNVRFLYAGGFTDEVESNKIIFEKEKLKYGQVFKGSVEVSSPGIYYFEFDNSYSWVTSKKIGYKYQVLSSLQIQFSDRSRVYENLMWTQIDFKSTKLLKLQDTIPKPKPSQNPKLQTTQLDEIKQKTKQNTNNVNQCEIELNSPKEEQDVKITISQESDDNKLIYILRIRKPNHIYEYELQSNDKRYVADRVICKLYLENIPQQHIITYIIGKEQHDIPLSEISEFILRSMPKQTPVGSCKSIKSESGKKQVPEKIQE